MVLYSCGLQCLNGRLQLPFSGRGDVEVTGVLIFRQDFNDDVALCLRSPRNLA